MCIPRVADKLMHFHFLCTSGQDSLLVWWTRFTSCVVDMFHTSWALLTGMLCSTRIMKVASQQCRRQRSILTVAVLQLCFQSTWYFMTSMHAHSFCGFCLFYSVVLCNCSDNVGKWNHIIFQCIQASSCLSERYIPKLLHVVSGSLHD